MGSIKKLVFVGLVIFCAGAVLAKQPEELLREAVYQEQVRGDIDKAVSLYETIIAETSEQRPVLAQAHYRLAECLLQQGKTQEAVAHFETVLREYPRQKEAGISARKALLKLKKEGKLNSVEPAKTNQPQVIDTYPDNYANNVSSDIDKISVTFDRRMADKSWSWVRWNYTFPERSGDIYYDSNKQTCTMPVKLQPATAYLVRINAEPYMSFISAKGKAARPFVFVFATSDKQGNPTEIPQEMLNFAKRINSANSGEMLLQKTHSDIGPNGIIKFNNTIQMKNETGRSLTKDSFINSDFVNVTAIYDANGDPLEYKTVHQDDIYRYFLTYNQPVKAGELIEYTMYGTIDGQIKPVAGQENTYRYFMNHSPATNTYVKRIETYLLPKGAELISTVPPDISREVESGRIKLHVEKIIPPGGNIVTSFMYRLDEYESLPSSKDKLKAEDLTSQGWGLWRERKLSEAEEKFEQAVKLNPRADNAWQGLGWAQLNQGKRLNAKESFEKCVEVNPENSAALNGLGWIAHGQGDAAEAIKWWEKAVRVSNGRATASLSGLTEVYMYQGKYEKAVEYYKMWLSAEPDSKQAKEGLQKAKEFADKIEKAVNAAKKWLLLIDAGNIGQSWEQAAKYFKKNVSKEQWRTSVGAVREPLGKLISRNVLTKKYTTALPGAPDGQYVVITFNASYQNKSSAIETVTPMLDDDGKWRVSGYYIK